MNHPIEALMKTAMESIKQMVDVNTIVGDAVETPDGCVVRKRYQIERVVLDPANPVISMV